MDESTAAERRSTVYRWNLAALSRSQPDVAAMVENVPVPDHVEAATGRDGSATFRLNGDDGKRVWFGRSSMPTISSAEAFPRLWGAASVALPGVLTGQELLVVVQKLPVQSAVYVLERDPLHIKLAFSLYDYADLLDQLRIVFLLLDDLGARLASALERHPGLGLPTRLLTVPQVTSAQTADLQRRLEEVGERAAAVQRRVVEDCGRQLHGRVYGPLPTQPRIAIISDDARPVTLDTAARLTRALGRLGWSFTCCVPDRPDRCHLAARISAVAESRAELVIFLNTPPGPLATLLPQDLPTASWYVAPPTPGASKPLNAPVDHLYFVASRHVAEALAGVGVAPEALRPCGLATDPSVYRRLSSDVVPDGEGRTGVAILADLPDLRPQAYGVTLTSHVSLWQSMYKVIMDRVDETRARPPEYWLRAAQAASGVPLNEPTVRERFLRLLQAVIVPACRTRAAAVALVKARFPVTVRGRNWDLVEGNGCERSGPIPNGDLLNQLFNTVGALVLTETSVATLQLAIDALSTGTGVVMFEPDHPFEEEFPALAALSPCLMFYRTRVELVRRIRDLLSADRSRTERRERAALLLHGSHTVTHRLRSMVDQVRAVRTASGLAVGGP